MCAAYYNESDPFAAAWLRELIKAGHIAQGVVDERDVRDVLASDLRGYSQHHFFAGVGGWSRALRLAGWPDNRSVWTGSCPCEPYSPAGKRKGAADDRDLWWAWYHLISECRPPVVFGEEVADAIDFGWLDTVQDDMEGIGYATWAHGLAACNLGAPHQRKRLFFVADSGTEQGNEDARRRVENCMAEGSLGNAEQAGSHGIGELGRTQEGRRLLELEGSGHVAGSEPGDDEGGRPSHLGGFWADAKWLWCRDGKYRATEPRIQPLADGVPARVGLLRGAGNAIVPQAAEAFIRAYLSQNEAKTEARSDDASKKVLPLSLLLYPGSKKWFVPFAAKYFGANPCTTLIEPFAGSAVVGLSLLYAGIVERLVLVERDPRIVCLLNGVLNDPNLADRYAAFNCNRANVEELIRTEKSAFRYVVQSRCTNGGWFDGGLRMPIDDRWCRDAVSENIRHVYALRDRVTLIEGDGLEVISESESDPSIGCYADPPYTASVTSKGHTVYRYHKLNHQKLFSMLARRRGPWLLTEDNSQMVRNLALCYRFTSKQPRMVRGRSKEKNDLMLWRERRVF